MFIIFLFKLIDAAASETVSKPTTPVEGSTADPQTELGLTENVKVCNMQILVVCTLHIYNLKSHGIIMFEFVFPIL